MALLDDALGAAPSSTPGAARRPHYSDDPSDLRHDTPDARGTGDSSEHQTSARDRRLVPPCRPTARPPALIPAPATPRLQHFFPASSGPAPGRPAEPTPSWSTSSSAGPVVSGLTTDAVYRPAEPYVPADPHVPFAIAAVELAEEKMVVMGQVVAGCCRR